MASTLNSVPAANSASGNAVNAQNSGRPSLRPSASTKGDGRRQSGSPGDGGQRYVPPLRTPTPTSTRSTSTRPPFRCFYLLLKTGDMLPCPSFSSCPLQPLNHCVYARALSLRAEAQARHCVPSRANCGPRDWGQHSLCCLLVP